MMAKILSVKRQFLFSCIFAMSLTSSYAQQLSSDLTDNLSAQQIEDLKDELKTETKDSPNNLPTSEMPQQQNTRDIDDSEELKEEDKKTETDLPDEEQPESLLTYYYKMLTNQKLDIFGHKSLNSEIDKKLLFYNTPGNDYQVGAGDVLQVITRGLSVINEEVQIDNLGRLTLPIINPFSAHGKTLIEIKNHITEELRTGDASASTYVSLNATRLVKVTVTGEVNKPQTIAVPAYTPLSQVLYRVGGISDLGSLRNITLTNALKGKKRIDLYNILREPENFEDPLITTSTRIHVNDIGSTVAVSGFAGRQMIFELPYGENQILVEELIQLAHAKLAPIGTTYEVLRFNGEGTVESNSFKSQEGISLTEGQALRIMFTEIRNLKEVTIEGEVLKPFTLIAREDGISIKETLKNGAALTKDAIERIALIHSRKSRGKSVTVINLKRILNGSEDLLLFPGDTLKILNEKSYKETLENVEDNIKFRDSSLIYLNENVVALIPNFPEQTVAEAVKGQLLLNEEITRDFALLTRDEFLGTDDTRAFNLGVALESSESQKIIGKSDINLFTRKYLSEKLFALDKLLIEDDQLIKIRKTNPIEFFVNGIRIGILPPDTVLNQTNLVQELKINKGLYPLFARITNNNQMGSKLEKTFINTKLSNILFDNINFKPSPGQRIDIFTTQFVRNLFSESEEERSTSLELSSSDTNDIIEMTDLDLENELNINDKQSEEIQTTKYTLAALKRASRLLTGAVENPGFYPIATEVSLSDLIEVAGGTLPGSDVSRISIRKYETNSKGISNISETLILDATSVKISDMILSGNFDVTIPNFVNDAAVGMVKINGEVLRPGEYLVSRNETLSEVIERAGGLTKVAYPLGLNFARDTLKAQERQTNIILANRLEQSIISLSQNQQEGAGEQINAILAYAKQLRMLPVNGRQTVNYASLSQKDNIYLEDGDTIFIPKRPSHVSITGRVQNATIASYEKNKNLEDYINDAGGLDRIADIKNIFVTLPNGQSLTQEGLKESGGIIPPGSVIIIPPKTDKLSLLGLTEVFSKVLGNIATSILAINAVSN